MKWQSYKFREHVIFHDENQCEVKGEVLDETNYHDRTILLIELDNDEGYYRATIMKRGLHERTDVTS